MITPQYQQLERLVETVGDICSRTEVSFQHALLDEANTALSFLQQQLNVATHAELSYGLGRDIAQYQQRALLVLEVPLKTFRLLSHEAELPHLQKVALLLELGRTYDVLAQWGLAQDVFREALECASDSQQERAEVLMRLGHLKSKLQDYPAATELYEESLAIYRQLEDTDMAGNIVLCMGYNAFDQSLFQQAHHCFHEALSLAETEGLPALRAQAHQALGMLATVQGDLAQAEQYYEGCLDTYEALGDLEGLASVYHNLGMLQVDQGQWARAGESYQHSLELAEQLSNVELMGLVHLNRIELAFVMWDSTLAEASCREAMKLFTQMGSLPRMAEIHKFYGVLHHRRQEWDRSRHAFERSLELFRQLGQPMSIAEVCHAYGMMLQAHGELEAARNQLEQALGLFERLQASGDADQVRHTLNTLEQDFDEPSPVQGKIRVLDVSPNATVAENY